MGCWGAGLGCSGCYGGSCSGGYGGYSQGCYGCMGCYGSYAASCCGCYGGSYGYGAVYDGSMTYPAGNPRPLRQRPPTRPVRLPQ